MLKFTPLPTWVEYSDDMPDDVGGWAKCFYVRIREKYRDKDIGIHKHEYLHVTQYYVVLTLWLAACAAQMQLAAPEWQALGIVLMPVGLCLHPVLNTFLKRYRYAMEVMAYREQAKWYQNDRRPKFAGFIAHNYGLDVTAEQALKALREE